MSQVRSIIDIVMHTDSETGLHAIGELDYSVPTTTHEMFDNDETGNLRREVASWLHRVAHGVEHEEWFSLNPRQARMDDEAQKA